MTKGQKKILLFFGIICSILILFWIIIYLPQRSKMKRLKEYLISAQNEIKGIEEIFGSGEHIDQILDKLQKKQEEYGNKLPQGEESTLRLLSQEAGNLGIKIISLNPARKKVYDKEEEPVIVEGCVCHELLINMELECSYMTLGKYIEILREGFPTLITVELLKINTDPKFLPKLKIELGIKVYMLIPK